MKRSAKTQRETPKRAPSLTREELFLVRQYVREGATEDRLGRVARRARMTEQHARTLLKRPHVQAELALQKQILRMEQAKLDAQDINRREQQAEAEQEVLLKPIERKALRRIEKLVEADPAELNNMGNVMNVLKMALVVTGTIRDGRTERLTPPEGPAGGRPSGDVPAWFAPRPMMGAEKAEPLYGAAPSDQLPADSGQKDAGEPASQRVSEPAPVRIEEPAQAEVLEVKVEKKGKDR